MNDTVIIENTGNENFPPKPLVRERESNPYISALVSLLMYAAFGYMLGGGSLVVMGALVVVLLIHESGHLAAMWLYGYKKLRMLFVPMMGALAIGDKQDISDKEESVILLAGPLPGIIIGYVLLYFSLGYSSGNEFVYDHGGLTVVKGYYPENVLLFAAARLFIILNVINLLPFFPLDGGQLFRALFFRSGFTPYFIFAVISLALLLLLFSGSITTIVLLVVFFGRPLYNQFRAQGYYKELRRLQVDHHKTYDELSDRDFWLMREALSAYSSNFKYIMPDQFRIFPVANEMEIQAIRSLLERRQHNHLGAAGKTLFILIWLVSLLSVFAADYFVPGSVGVLERLGL